jgi:hypothetical protein
MSNEDHRPKVFAKNMTRQHNIANRDHETVGCKNMSHE